MSDQSPQSNPSGLEQFLALLLLAIFAAGFSLIVWPSNPAAGPINALFTWMGAPSGVLAMIAIVLILSFQRYRRTHAATHDTSSSPQQPRDPAAPPSTDA